MTEKKKPKKPSFIPSTLAFCRKFGIAIKCEHRVPGRDPSTGLPSWKMSVTRDVWKADILWLPRGFQGTTYVQVCAQSALAPHCYAAAKLEEQLGDEQVSVIGELLDAGNRYLVFTYEKYKTPLKTCSCGQRPTCSRCKGRGYTGRQPRLRRRFFELFVHQETSQIRRRELSEAEATRAEDYGLLLVRGPGEVSAGAGG